MTSTVIDRDGWQGDLPEKSSQRRFSDGASYRVEIPSVEGPQAFLAVLQEAHERNVSVDRISQGSGIMLQTDAELAEMVALGRERSVDICLFVGPRGSWDIGVQVSTKAGAVMQGSMRGAEQLGYAVRDVERAVELGVGGVLVSDIGLLKVLGDMKTVGHLPSDLILKTSIALPAANPAAAQVLEELGATSINLPLDLTIDQIAAIRKAVSVPLDIYIEGPSDYGGCLRYYEAPEIIRVAAPVHLKFGLRNAPPLYPSGYHLESTVVDCARERVRRAAIAIDLIEKAEHAPGGRRT